MGVSSRLDILRIGWNQNMSHGQNGWRPLWYSVAFAEALLSHVYQTLEGDMVPSPKEITITVAITEMWRILMGAHMFIYLVNVHLYLSNILHISIKHFTHIYIYTVYEFMYMNISIYEHICNLHICVNNTCIYTYIYIYIIHIYIYIIYIWVCLAWTLPSYTVTAFLLTSGSRTSPLCATLLPADRRVPRRVGYQLATLRIIPLSKQLVFGS